MHPDQQNQYQPQQTPNAQPQTGEPYPVVPPIPPAGNNGHSGHNPYEFILSPKTQKPRHLFQFGGSVLARVGVAVGGMAVLVVALAIGASLLAPKSSTPGLTAIAQRQQEIVRVSTAATTQTTGQDTKNFVANVNISVSSSQQQVVTYLGSSGAKLKPSILALDQSAQTDTLLANAASANNYDAAAAQNLTEQLQTYQGLLRTTYNATASKRTKQLLQDCFTSANKLLLQAKALSPTSG